MADSFPLNEQQLNIYIGSRLRFARKSRKLTMVELSKHINISYQQLQKYETGHNRISVSKLINIARILDRPISFFCEV